MTRLDRILLVGLSALTLGCGHPKQRAEANVVPVKPPRSSDRVDCGKPGKDAQRFFVDGDLASNDVEAIKKAVATVSHLPVVTIRTKPDGFQELATGYGGEAVEVYTFQSSSDGSAASSEGELFIVVRKAHVWQVVDTRRRWKTISCD